jgi:gluconolactonase
MKRVSTLLFALPVCLLAACGSSDDGASGGADSADLGKNPIQGVAAAKTLIETGQYTDGPVWVASEQVLLYTVPLNQGDIPGLYRVKPDGSAMKVRGGDMKSGALPIGNGVTPNGDVITVEAKRIMRGGGADAVPIAEGFPGADGLAKFDTLNDVVVHKSGAMFVTDPGYFADPPPLTNRIYRVGPDGAVTVAGTFENIPRPNGVALSPDQKILYVGFEKPQQGTKPYIEKYNISDDGNLMEHSKFTEFEMDSSPDGVEVDKAGNVYVATKAGIEVFKQDGKKIGVVKIPDQPTGMAFGGADLKTLYVTTAKTKIYELKLNVPGINQ